jgi:ankyrin repeat protein
MIQYILKYKIKRRVAEDNMAVRGLFDAISTMQFKLSKILIEGNVDVNIAVAGVTPLMTACVIPQQSNNKGKYQLIELLLKYGSDLNSRDDIGRTALHYAHMCNCSWSISFLEKTSMYEKEKVQKKMIITI